MVCKKRSNGTKMNPAKELENSEALNCLLVEDSKGTSRVSHKMNLTLGKLTYMSFFIVSHVAFTGHAQKLKAFLRQHAHKLVFVGHPFSYASQKKSIAEFYENGILEAKVTAPHISGPEILLYFKDFVMSFYFLLKFRMKFHVYIGVDPLNALVGLILKRLGFVQITIFYVIDYVPLRFKNVILNNLYLFIDRLCVYSADYTWNLTSVMADARQKIGIIKDKTNQITVPTGTPYKKIRNIPIGRSGTNNIVFLSHLRKGQGIELVLEALPEVIKEIPSVKLIVIGTGPMEKYFKEEVKKRNIDNNVVFLGYIESHDEIERIVSKCRVGIAPYVPVRESFTWYADPGKPKVYLGSGIPVIITKVPEVAFEISKREAGIAINYSSHELSTASIAILKDDRLYKKFRTNAIQFASELNWDFIFVEAFSKLHF